MELGVPVLTALPVNELETEPLAVTKCVCLEDATEDVPDGPPVVTGFKVRVLAYPNSSHLLPFHTNSLFP